MSRIIFVDDDRTNSRLIKMLLEMDGYEVSVCPTIEQAVLKAGEASAFVVDCHLAEGRNGIELVREVRQNRTGAAADTPVIITSGDFRQERDALLAGANRFMLKPYTPADLSASLQKLLSEG